MSESNTSGSNESQGSGENSDWKRMFQRPELMEWLFNGTPNNNEEAYMNNQLVQRINQLEELLNTVANSQYVSPNSPPSPVGKQKSHKIEAPNSFASNPMTLHRWINQVETYFHLTRMTDDVDQVKMISLLVSRKASI